jgi:hypothetical protein
VQPADSYDIAPSNPCYAIDDPAFGVAVSRLMISAIFCAAAAM